MTNQRGKSLLASYLALRTATFVLTQAACPTCNKNSASVDASPPLSATESTAFFLAQFLFKQPNKKVFHQPSIRKQTFYLLFTRFLTYPQLIWFGELRCPTTLLANFGTRITPFWFFLLQNSFCRRKSFWKEKHNSLLGKEIWKCCAIENAQETNWQTQ